MTCGCAITPAPSSAPTFGAWGVAAQWQGGGESRWSESKKLASLDPRMRNKVTALMARMRSLGHKPMLFYAWRSLETQAGLQAGGTSWVNFSFHNALNAQGEPAALGADIVDADVWWGAAGPAEKARADRFFADLGREAKKLGLYWGGDWRNPDSAHVQLFPNSALSSVKAASEAAMQRLQSTAGQAYDAARSTENRLARAGFHIPPWWPIPVAALATMGVLLAVTRRRK